MGGNTGKDAKGEQERLGAPERKHEKCLRKEPYKG